MTTEQELELAKALIRNAVDAMLMACGNSYVNAWTEHWLTNAQRIGAYDGPLIGKIDVVADQYDVWASDKQNEHLFHLPD